MWIHNISAAHVLCIHSVCLEISACHSLKIYTMKELLLLYFHATFSPWKLQYIIVLLTWVYCHVVLACHGAYWCRTSVLFFPKKIVMLATLMFISLVLFQFGWSALSVEAFKQFAPKVCILVQQCLVRIVRNAEVLFVLNMHSFHGR